MDKLSKIEEILNFVQKSARYINNELNSHPANMSADLENAYFPEKKIIPFVETVHISAVPAGI